MSPGTRQPFRLMTHPRLRMFILGSVIVFALFSLLILFIVQIRAANPDPDQGVTVLNDPLSNNNQGNDWTENDHCQFTDGSYQASITKSSAIQLCTSDKRDFRNLTFKVKMKIVQGDCGGIAFRWDSATNEGYIFEICQDRSYALYKSNKSSTKISRITGGKASAIDTGLYQVNTIAVTAEGGKLSFYDNEQLIAKVRERTYDQGSIGVIAGSRDNPTVVNYSDANVEIPSIPA